MSYLILLDAELLNWILKVVLNLITISNFLKYFTELEKKLINKVE